MRPNSMPTEQSGVEEARPSACREERILIVDDESLVRTLLTQFVRKEGLIPLEASSAKEALRLIRRERPAMVLLDVCLPDANGLEFLTTQLQPELGPYRVIIITGEGNQQDAHTAVLHGAYDYMLKPVPLHRLKIAIRNCLELHRLTRELGEASGEATSPVPLGRLVGTSPQIQEIVTQVKQLAPYDVPLLILGENGTGKDLVARAIHTLSPRRTGPFVPIDAGALPDGLVEGELFGYERGAFSGAVVSKPGWLEQANGGTILLDEIGNIPATIQAKLLRVLESRTVARLGGQRAVPLDVRVLSATNADVEQMVADGRFRRDLYHRLMTATIRVPALRDRVGDIPLLAHYELLRAARAFKKPVHGISQTAMALLEAYPWPGNVRELINGIRAAVILADTMIEPEHLPLPIRSGNAPRADGSVGVGEPDERLDVVRRRAADAAERAAITRMLERTGGNKAEAARRFGIDYKTLWTKMRYHGL